SHRRRSWRECARAARQVGPSRPAAAAPPSSRTSPDSTGRATSFRSAAARAPVPPRPRPHRTARWPRTTRGRSSRSCRLPPRQSRRREREFPACRRSWAAENPLARVHGDEPRAGNAEESLDLAQYEKTAWRERAMKLLEQAFLRVTIEVDQHVAADDQIVRRRGRRISQEV